MININTYRQTLINQGKTIADIRRNQSNEIMNATFTQDPTYKKVYVLTKDGWKFEDAKYQFHTAASILRDAVDYYLQFRPKVHYPIGTYIIVPDDTDPDINLTGQELKDPFLQPPKKRTQWWMIVNRDEANSFVRYSILKCNWNFQWMYKGQIQSCFGCVRNANSYTSGKWTDEISSTVDNLTNAWLPATHLLYGDKLEQLHVCDTRTVFYEQRFMLTNNILEPKVYQVTKVIETAPQGLIKLSLKQDEYNSTRDNVDLLICDYYIDSGESKLPDPEPENVFIDETLGTIKYMRINENDELEYANFDGKVHIGAFSYFKADVSNSHMHMRWHITYLGNEDKDYYEGLFKMEEVNDTTLSLKPGKAKSLIGKKFTLSVFDEHDALYSSIDLEVDE